MYNNILYTYTPIYKIVNEFQKSVITNRGSQKIPSVFRRGLTLLKEMNENSKKK